jgi:ankyrin repeat protein
VSFRQLRLEELGEVFAIRVDAKATRIPEFHPAYSPQNPEAVVQSTCPSLVAVVDVRGDQVAQFSHFSVQEFLVSQDLKNSQELSKYQVSPLSAHAFFARACLSVLLQLGDGIDKLQLKNFPLASYAAEHWVDHAKYRDDPGVVSPDILAGMKCLFDKEKPHFKAWIWLYNVDKLSPESTTHPIQPDVVPLYYAALCGFLDITEHLIDVHPEDVSSRGGNHVTPLHAALDKGHLNIALLLLQNGADPAARGIEGQTPCHIASDRGYINIVNALIDHHGADPNAENDAQETPLFMASKSGQEEVANKLLVGGADANHRDRNGWTPLHVASQKGHDHIVRLLLDSGRVPNIDPQDINHNTPLHIASCHGKVVVVTTLLDRGANVKARDRQGGTPLHDASQRGHLEIVRLLLKHGADSRARDRKGETAFEMASRKGYSDVAQLLGKHAGDGA